MELVRQIVVILLLLGLLAGAFFSVVFGLGLIHLDTATYYLSAVYGNALFVLVGLLFFAVGLFLLVPVFTSGPGINTIVKEGSLGDVRVALAAINSLVKRIASQMDGVRDLRTRIRTTSEGIQVMLRLVVNSDSNVPELTEDIQRRISGQVHETLGITVASVEVMIRDISAQGEAQE